MIYLSILLICITVANGCNMIHHGYTNIVYNCDLPCVSGHFLINATFESVCIFNFSSLDALNYLKMLSGDSYVSSKSGQGDTHYQLTNSPAFKTTDYYYFFFSSHKTPIKVHIDIALTCVEYTTSHSITEKPLSTILSVKDTTQQTKSASILSSDKEEVSSVILSEQGTTIYVSDSISNSCPIFVTFTLLALAMLV